MEMEPEPKLWVKSEPEPKINNFGSATLVSLNFSFPSLNVLFYVPSVVIVVLILFFLLCQMLF